MSANVNISQWTPNYFKENENECVKILEQEVVWNTIPLLNTKDSEYYENGKLVRFRGMIQDMHDTEFYLESFEVKRKDSNETFMKNGKYIDLVHSEENELILTESSKNITSERGTYVVISVPGLNSWAETLEKQENNLLKISENETQIKPAKRTLENEEPMDLEPSTSEKINNPIKKHCSVETSSKSTSSNDCTQNLLFNYPIPNRPGKTCLMKLYNDSQTLKLNETIEFVGFLSNDPALGHFEKAEFENEMELKVHHPPSSLIPRIHCVSWRRIEHSNPLLKTYVINNDKMAEARKDLLLVLTSFFLGDALAAEYLLCHLLSKVYSRVQLQALGKFSLNISNIPVDVLPNFAQELYGFLEKILPKSHLLDLTIKNINEVVLIPKKNYDYNRLNSGLLQLSTNTHLVIDETKLTTGELNSTGVHNIRALSNVIKNQKIDCDFVYYQMEYDCDIPVLILSKDKSLIPSDIHLPLQPDTDLISSFTETINAAKTYLKPEILNNIRVYLTVARLSNFEISADDEKIIEGKLVELIKEQKPTVDDLHNLLVLNRLISFSKGKTCFDNDVLQQVHQMEMSRKERIITFKNGR